ncbi:MAG: glycosyltransferase family 2 protein [Clostridiales bacterium]|nr:glycosyltransferase family 2 protein [Clostridiales bacterium]
MSNKRHIEVIVPCYNEEECVPLFYEALAKDMAPLPYTWSILFVDDGSRDDTLAEIKKLAFTHGNDRIRYISFSRNFGKEAALFAGFSESRGDLLAIMDADLQDPPGVLPEMLEGIDEGYDCVALCRSDRKGEPPIRSFFANMFYRLINKASSVKLKPGARDCRLMTRAVADAMLAMGERERFSKGLFEWVGFKVKWIEYEHVPRAAGTSKWSFWSLLKYAVSGIVAFSTAPLRLSYILGAVVVLAAVAYGLFIFFRTAIYGAVTSGFATTIIIMLFLGGIVISLLGIIGEYIARIYMEIKRRPIYLRRETNIVKEGERFVRQSEAGREEDTVSNVQP